MVYVPPRCEARTNAGARCKHITHGDAVYCSVAHADGRIPDLRDVTLCSQHASMARSYVEGLTLYDGAEARGAGR